MTPRLLALRPLGLGDLLTALPALRALADAFPGHHRVLAGTAGLEELALAAGAVHEVVPVAPLAPLPGWLSGADVAVNLHGRGPQSHAVLRASRPRRIIAFASAEAGVDGPRWRADEHEVLRWCRMLRESGVPADPSRLELRIAPDPAAAGATVVHPGAAAAGRRWPAGRFAAVARAERDAGRRVIVTGGPGEVDLAHRVAAAAGLPPGAVRAGSLGVMGLARIVAGAARVVVSDTGVAHLATALGRPSVVVFGPTPPALWGPPAGDPRHRALWAGRPGDPHAAVADPGLLEIGVADVLDALASLPRAHVPAPAAG